MKAWELRNGRAGTKEWSHDSNTTTKYDQQIEDGFARLFIKYLAQRPIETDGSPR